MNFKKIIFLLLFLPTVLIFSVSCNTVFSESDAETFQLVSFYDLRERESFVQITNTSSLPAMIHVQIFDVGNNCNENDFFDDLTGNDTHVYNLRDIQTNNGNSSGVILPNSAYGIVVITAVTTADFPPDVTIDQARRLISNFRVIDSLGYEYRTNALGIASSLGFFNPVSVPEFYLNYNNQNGVVLSDVVGFTLDDAGLEDGTNIFIDEVLSADIININLLVDVDIFDLNENVFSCRNVIFACTDQDNPLLEELLAEVGGANVASFEYGINEAIPHSKGGELLCPGNTISEGIVRLRLIDEPSGPGFAFGLYIGLNNGNGRGSMDSYWGPNAPLEIANLSGGGDGDGADIMPPDDGGDT